MSLEALFADFPRRDWDTDPEGTVRMAFVGLGGFTRNYSLPAVASADYCEPTVVVSGTPEKRESVAGEYDAVGLSYEEYEDGAATDGYDAVYVATPNRLHLPHVRTAAGHGKHVVCEKPLEATPERAGQVVEACEEAGVTLMTAYRMQADPMVRRLRAFLRGGGLGEVVRLYGDFTYPVLAGSHTPDHWRVDADLAGGGALFDVGVYPLNTARFLLGADPVAVAGTTSRSEPITDVDEHVAFQVQFPDEVVGSFSAGFSGTYDSWFSVQGTEGTVRVVDAFGPQQDRRVVVRRGADRVTLDGLGADEVREEFDYFASRVLSGERPEPDGADGLEDVRAMAAVYEAAAAGRRVEL